MSHALQRPVPTLPSAWYIDPAHHLRELEAIWYRDWVYAGRESRWAQNGDYHVIGIGT